MTTYDFPVIVDEKSFLYLENGECCHNRRSCYSYDPENDTDTYVLMPNPFHLLVQTPQSNLSEFMRHFLVTYSARFNRRNGRAGHVFQDGLNHCWSMKMSIFYR